MSLVSGDSDSESSQTYFLQLDPEIGGAPHGRLEFKCTQPAFAFLRLMKKEFLKPLVPPQVHRASGQGPEHETVGIEDELAVVFAHQPTAIAEEVVIAMSPPGAEPEGEHDSLGENNHHKGA